MEFQTIWKQVHHIEKKMVIGLSRMARINKKYILLSQGWQDGPLKVIVRLQCICEGKVSYVMGGNFCEEE